MNGLKLNLEARSNIFRFVMSSILLINYSEISATSLTDRWHYSTAAYSAQQNEWEHAYKEMSGLLVNNYDRADLLYDTGVTVIVMVTLIRRAIILNVR